MKLEIENTRNLHIYRSQQDPNNPIVCRCFTSYKERLHQFKEGSQVRFKALTTVSHQHNKLYLYFTHHWWTQKTPLVILRRREKNGLGRYSVSKNTSCTVQYGKFGIMPKQISDGTNTYAFYSLDLLSNTSKTPILRCNLDFVTLNTLLDEKLPEYFAILIVIGWHVYCGRDALNFS